MTMSIIEELGFPRKVRRSDISNDSRITVIGKETDSTKRGITIS